MTAVDPKGLDTVLIEVGGELFRMIGVRTSAGIYITTGGETGPANAGIILNIGAGFGNDIGLDASATYLEGGMENVEGNTITTNMDILRAGIESHINPETNEHVGYSAGISFGREKLMPSYTISYNLTFARGFMDIANSISVTISNTAEALFEMIKDCDDE